MKTIEILCKELITGATNALFEKSEQKDKKTTHLLTGSSISLNGEIIQEQLSNVIIKEGKDIRRFKLVEGDVVLLSKGNSIRAGYVNNKIASLNVIASANFILLRPKQEQLIGEVLVTFFNSQAGQNLLDATSTGAVIKNISLSNIKKLELDLPALEQQKKISALFHASNQAYQSTINLATQQKKVATACISQLMKGAA